MFGKEKRSKKNTLASRVAKKRRLAAKLQKAYDLKKEDEALTSAINNLRAGKAARSKK